MSLLFSIITPSYQARSKLETTWLSLRGQSKDNLDYYEWIVVDGASSDNTAHWLESLPSRGLHWVSEADCGVYDAMNKGIQMSKGRFLVFLGAGDLLMPAVLARAEEHLGSGLKTKPRLLYGNVLYQRCGKIGDGKFDRSRICRKNICHQAIFYERSIFDLVGGYETCYSIMADWALNLRVMGDSRIDVYYWNEVIAEFEEGGLSDLGMDVLFAKNRLKLIRERLGAWYYWRYRVEEAIKRRWARLFARN